MGNRDNLNTGWFVYILYCGDNSLYTGITTDLQRRLQEHNDSKLGARYTRARRPVSLVWFEQCVSRSEASLREADIKKLDRRRKVQLITGSRKIKNSTLTKLGVDQPVFK